MRRVIVLLLLGALLGVVADESDDEEPPELAEEAFDAEKDIAPSDDAEEEPFDAAKALSETKEEDKEFTFVQVLTKDNFDKFLQDTERVLVQFYDPENSDCKALHPDYTKASKLLKAEELDTIAAKVDATVETELAARFEVKTFPTLKYFVKGKFLKDYDGKLTEDGLAAWLKIKETPPVKEIKEDDLDGFLDDVEDDNFAVVAHVKKKSARAKMFYRSVEDTLMEWDIAKIKFAVVWLPKGADPKADAKLVMHRPGSREPDSEDLDYTGVWSEEKITRWVKTGAYATLGKVFTRGKYAPMSMEEMDWTAAVIGVVDDQTETEGKSKRTEKLKPQVEEALLPFAIKQPKWKFVMADIEKLEDHELELLGVAYGSDPRIVVLHDRKKFHLAGEDEIKNPVTIQRFLDDVKAKKAKPFYKSAEPPDEGEEYDKDGILILTGSTFEEKALDARQDVFVLFYQTECDHSKKLLPVWAEMASQGAKAGWKNENVVMAKMEIGGNECAEEIISYPKMVLYPAVQARHKMSKKSIYSGERDAEMLVDFVTSRARNLQDSDDEEEEEEEEKPKKKRRKGNKGASDAGEL